MVTENGRSGDDNFMIIIHDDDDDTNPLIAIAGSRGAPGPAPDAAATLPAEAVATPAPPAPHGSAESMNIGGAPPAASTAALTILPPPASVALVTITRAPLATIVSVATQTAPDHLVNGNNGSSEASARYTYGGNGKVVARYSNGCGKSLASYGNVDYGKGVASYSEVGYGSKGLAGCSSGSHTPTTHLLPLEVRATKAMARCIVTLSVRTRSSPHPRHRESTLLVITGSWRRRARQS
ncbi:unnamed protein product [Miscanthus lutarioriparius]|uniref:Uncharacterized protein n=1 Tax=Miscanthus lutarioriparius TaxID=422564 RepID=A0A811RZ06_9POAL|nr:unnamed protein product [Miscanthus lutarioriparius]